MAQALALIVPAFQAGGSLALLTSAGGLTLAGVGVNLLGSQIIGRLLAPSTPRFDQSAAVARPDNVQINTKVAAAVRLCHYGRVKVGGNAVFHRARDGVSYRIFVHGHGQITEVEQVFLNNSPVTVNGSGFVTNAQYFLERPRVRVLSRLGDVPSAHYAEVTAVWPEWTESHRLDGLWTSLMIAESVGPDDFRAMYPRGEPELQVRAKGRALFDPRTGQTSWSENIALAIADLIASPDGFGRPDALDLVNIAEEASICDRQVALAGGGVEALWRVGGSYKLSEAPQQVMQTLLDACAGRVKLTPGGKVALRVGAWRPPEFTLRLADVLSVEELSFEADALDYYTVLPGRFVSQDLGFIEVDAEAFRDEARIQRDGGETVGEAVDLVMCPSQRQARLALQIKTARDNPDVRIKFVCKPRVLPAIFEDIISLDLPEFGLSGGFEIDSYALSFEGSNLASVQLSLRSIGPDAFAQALADQGVVQELPEPDTSAGVPVPVNVTASGAGVQGSATTFTAGIGVGWQAPPSDALVPVLRYSPAGDNAWLDVPVGADLQSVLIGNLIDGNAYDIWLAWRTPGGVIGAPVIVEDVIARAVTAPPAAPQNLGVTDLLDQTALVSMTAASDAGLWKTEIRRDGALVATIFAAPGQLVEFVDACGAGSFSWTARSINVSGIASSSDAGPVTVSIT